LVGSVIGVLANDHHAYRIKVAELKSGEHLVWRRIDDLLLPRGLDLRQARLEVGLLQLRAQGRRPARAEGDRGLRAWLPRRRDVLSLWSG
jgi:hypothetical protein